jgi:methylphosphotriester-DNA--protein-cysteine methyltransferase
VSAPDPLVAHAVARLFSPAAPSTSALAAELGYSRQHLRRLFLHHVGLAPKELGRIARLQRAVDHLQRFPAHALARAAVALGYFDQAHLARELRLLAGISATDVRAHPGSIFPIRSLFAGADCLP